MKFAVRKKRAPSIIIVSLVDVLVILLIFFVVSTTFKTDQSQVQINLPETKTGNEQPAETEHVVITIDQEDAIKLDGKEVDPDGLQAAVKELPATRKSTIALQADKKASFGIIIKVMDALKLAGVKKSCQPSLQPRKMRLEIQAIRRPCSARAKGRLIGEVDDRLRTLVADMIETMREANGVGLAAQQIGEAIQLTVIDVRPAEDRPSTLVVNGRPVELEDAMPMVLLNPELTLGREIVSGTEGCLSFPEISAEIDRSEAVHVRAKTLEGETIEIAATGLLARALQHETDHLNGILFIDRMSSSLKVSLAGKLKRLQKETEAHRSRPRRAPADQRAL